MTAAVLFGGLVLFLAVGVPVAFAIGFATLAAIFVQGLPALAIAQKALTGIDSFPLLAMPLFLLAAELMTGGALADVLVRFALMFVGPLKSREFATDLASLLFHRAWMSSFVQNEALSVGAAGTAADVVCS